MLNLESSSIVCPRCLWDVCGTLMTLFYRVPLLEVFSLAVLDKCFEISCVLTLKFDVDLLMMLNC